MAAANESARTEGMTIRQRANAGTLAGALGCLFGVMGIFFIGIVFVPLAALCGITALVRGINSRNPTAIGLSVVAGILCFWGFATSPSLWLLIGIGGLASLMISHHPAPVTASSAQRIQAFDLVCSSTSGPAIHFRFDLSGRRWCSGPCSSVWSIDELSDSQIKVSVRSPDHMKDWDVFLNRYNGNYSAVHIGFGNAPADQGHCLSRSFSGFPNRQF